MEIKTTRIRRLKLASRFRYPNFKKKKTDKKVGTGSSNNIF